MFNRSVRVDKQTNKQTNKQKDSAENIHLTLLCYTGEKQLHCQTVINRASKFDIPHGY